MSGTCRVVDVKDLDSILGQPIEDPEWKTEKRYDPNPGPAADATGTDPDGEHAPVDGRALAPVAH